MLNSKAWLSKYIPILHPDSQGHQEDELNESSSLLSSPGRAQQPGFSQSELRSRRTDEEHFDLSEIENWNDLGGHVWDWQADDDEKPINSRRNFEDEEELQALDYVESDIGDEMIIKSAYKCCQNPKDFKKQAKTFFKHLGQRTPYYIPIIRWLPKYEFKENLLADILCGLTIAAVIIPQGIAFSSLAYVPPVIGLYTALFPNILYFLLGTSRQLSIGPEGVISLLTGQAIIDGIEDSGLQPYEYTVPRAALLAFLVGVVTLLLGIFRVGFLDNLISRPILHGFVSASALIILVGQLDTFLGFYTPETEWEKIVGVIENIQDTNVAALILSSSCLVVILFLDWFKVKFTPYFQPLKYIPTTFVIVVSAILVSKFADLHGKYGVPILDHVEGGFMKPAVPRFYDFFEVQDIIIEAILIAVVGFVESTAIAKSYARMYNYDVSANRELVAFGNANIISSFFSTYPAFGSLARSKIANAAGGRSQISALVASILVTITILFAMSLFTYLPKCAIAAIVIVAAGKLIEFHIGLLWKIRAWLEIFLTFFTFFATFFLGAELGIVLAVAISIFLVVKHTTLPNVAVLGKTSSGKWKDISVMGAEAQMTPGILVMRIDESLYFGNVEQLVKMINRLVTLGRLDAHPTDQSAWTEAVYGLVIDARNINTIDANAITVLKDFFESYVRKNVSIYFTQMKVEHCLKIKRAGLLKLIPESHFCSKIDIAVDKLIIEKQSREMMRESYQSTTPLVVPH